MAKILMNSGISIEVNENYNDVVTKFATETMTGHRFATFHRYVYYATNGLTVTEKVKINENYVEAIYE